MAHRHRGGVVLLLALLAACGGTSGDPPAADLTGTWSVLLMDDGVERSPMHLTVVQTEESVGAELTCNTEMPVGAGTYAAGEFHLVFDLGGGDAITLEGRSTATGLEGTWTAPDESGDWRMERNDVVLDCARACEVVPMPRFVDADFTELAKIEEISRFRSDAGHDYSDSCESCRSMKHYYAPYAVWRDNGLIQSRSPVDGTVISVRDEQHGASPGDENKQVHIRSTLHPELTFVLFHVDLTAPAVTPGTTVMAGEAIGYARLYYPDLAEYAHNFDIGVEHHTWYGERAVSFLDVMTDALFATYQARGVADRPALIIAKAARDGDPLTCDGETFTSTGSIDSWVALDPP